MCGRTACTLARDDIVKACSFNPKKGKGSKDKEKQRPVWRDAPGGQQYYPSYNIAPGAHTPVIISSKHYLGELDTITERVIQPMRWGLVPSWHKGDPKNVGYETNNCRAEGMLEKKTYKVPLEKGRRCVVLADGFYEWKRDNDKKQPYFIYFPQDTWVKRESKEETDLKLVKHEPSESEWSKQDVVDGNFNLKQENPEKGTSIKIRDTESERRLLTMAGVFDIWNPPDNSAPIYSYSVITVESSPAMSSVHHRMPAMLATDEEIEEWLNYGEVPLRKAVQCIHPSEILQMHPVSTAVGNSRYKSPDCVQPVDLKKPKPPVNTFMKNWLSQPKKEPIDGKQTPTIKSPAKSPSKKSSPSKQSKSTSLMMIWLAKGKRGPEETDNSVVKKCKVDD